MKQPALVALAVAAALSVGGVARQVPVFRAGVDLVNLGVTVADKKGSLITNLTANDFEIYEDGKKQTLRYFALGDAVNAGPPMHLGRGFHAFAHGGIL